jgi:hypothetical protein
VTLETLALAYSPLELGSLLQCPAMRSDAGMTNRRGDVDLRFAQVSAPQLALWLGLAWLVKKTEHDHHCTKYICTQWKVRPNSSVGIVTRYGLDGPAIEFRLRRGFSKQSKPPLGPTQPLV